jgi:hypothetical protein
VAENTTSGGLMDHSELYLVSLFCLFFSFAIEKQDQRGTAPVGLIFNLFERGVLAMFFFRGYFIHRGIPNQKHLSCPFVHFPWVGERGGRFFVSYLSFVQIPGGWEGDIGKGVGKWKTHVYM